MICCVEPQIPGSMKWGIIIKFSWHVTDLGSSHHPLPSRLLIVWLVKYEAFWFKREHGERASAGGAGFRGRDWPMTWMCTSALTDMFSIWTDSVYFPEWALSTERMKRMVSTSLVRVPTLLSSRRTPSLDQVTTGRGLPCSQSYGKGFKCKVLEDMFTGPNKQNNKVR